MFAVLTLIFLAALVGIIKPYVAALSRKQFAGIAVGTFILMMIVVPKSDQQTSNVDSNSADAATGTTPSNLQTDSTTSAHEDSPASKWQYSSDKDEMRGSTSRYATLISNNTVDLDFPYGEQQGTITVRRNSDGLNVMFGVGKGQIMCSSYTNTTISVKFDNGPIQKMRCTGASDGSNETAFFTNEGRVLAGLRKAKRTIIEAEFFHQGRQQFVFDTAGLEWK
ncbi:hypothetical protein [Sphingomonas sp. RIT328]|uniref:hypothetical protein n=1 Tax=Sphingomonas sp. RIT328 TaxID=1470591 RepID=UPI000452C631|nr:hypothetical protein [Sphingomonas sp. RIT328]EZP57279.1 hypothetical protein BW41_00122 [Sphingomonas sp. RIT328]